MVIEFYCSQCRNRLRVADSVAGQQAQCPVCGTIVTVPGITVAGQMPDAAENIRPEPRVSGEGSTPIPPVPPAVMGRPTTGFGGGAPPPAYGPQPTDYNPYATPQYSGQPAVRTGERREEGWGVAALILGLFGLLAWCCPIIGVLVGFLAVVFGIIALVRGGVALGVIGIILGVICLALSVINAILGVATMADPTADFAACLQGQINRGWSLFFK